MKTDYTEAIGLLVNEINTVGTEQVSLDEMYGRILAENITAKENVPSFSRSPYDGYAFRSPDTAGVSVSNPVTLEVIDNIKAGDVSDKIVEPGTAVRLMTGAALPEGADAICKYEDTEFDDEYVTLTSEFRPFENVIQPGEDIKEGTVIRGKGCVIDTGCLGTFSSQGITSVQVYKRPVAGIITTGDEVVDAEKQAPFGKIRNSNRYIIQASLKKIGFDSVYIGHAGDDREETVSLIEKGFEDADVIISTGGVSVGDYDLVPDAMETAGFKMLCRGVGIKPGMACAYGVKDGKLMLALSGNPSSSLTNLECICFPALRKLSGMVEFEHKTFGIKLASEWKKPSKGDRFLRGRIEIKDGEAYFIFSKEQGNVVISSAIDCNVYGLIPSGSGPFSYGDIIDGFLV